MSFKREIILNTFQELSFSKFGSGIDRISDIKADASDRKIFRIISGNDSFIGIFNENKEENNAFVNFSCSFRGSGFKVPEIYAVSDDKLFYLEEDLGETNLFKLISVTESEKIFSFYKKALTDLIQFQIKGKNIIDFNYCYQTMDFDEAVVESDIKKFNEYYSAFFIKENQDGDLLKNITGLTSEILSQTQRDFFLYRDFQPRNIMVKGNELYYIDYQSGRKGPLHYDLASFLYSGSIRLVESQRLELIDYYLKEIQKYIEIDKEKFVSDFYFFVFLRLIQMLGSYAYLNKSRNDKDVVKKISSALLNLKNIKEKINMKEVKTIIDRLTISFN